MKKVLLSLALIGAAGMSVTACNEIEVGFNEANNVTLYSREAGSGTRECFFEGIGYGDVKKEDKWNRGVNVQSVSSNGDIMTKVGQDVNAIGYCSLDSLEDGTNIKGLQFDGVTASEETAVDGSYKLKRNFNYVVRADSDYEAGSDILLAKKAFVAYMTQSKEGLLTIQANGGIINNKVLSIADATSWSELSKEFEGLNLR